MPHFSSKQGAPRFSARALALIPILSTLLFLHLGGCSEEESPLEMVQQPIVLPAQFADSRVAGLPSPTALAFTPDGRLLITTQGGALRVYRNGALLAAPALDLSSRLCTNSERGLLGVAVDPAFPGSPYVYLHYTFNKFGSCGTNQVGTSPINRISRFSYDSARDTIDVASELVLVDNILSLAGNHNGGDLKFGADGYLYASVGDSGCQLNNAGACAGANANARYNSTLSGKILRVASDGSIPPSNPFVGAAGARRCGQPGQTPSYSLDNTKPCVETFAWGLRNPFRFSFKPGTNQFFINDVGQNKWEEIDEGVRGANYGWNTREGMCARDSTSDCGAPPAGLTNPIHAYGRQSGCVSITGSAFVPGSAFGPDFTDAYLFADYGCGTIFKLTSSGGTYNASPFATSLGGSSVVSMSFGPGPNGQSLYYTTYAGGGEVRRIDYTGTANRPPTAVLTASPTSGNAPLRVFFDASASRDPDAGDTLSYRWSFGDGSSSTTATATTEHTYASVGVYTASLTVADNRGATSQPATVTLRPGNTAPSVTMTSPAAGDLFSVGQRVALRATASDTQDGNLPASALSWTVLKHHADHTHPFFGPASGNDLSVLTEGPEDLAATSNSYLEIRVTATDSQGLSTTLVRMLHPRELELTFRTSPPGLKLLLNNSDTVTAPVTVTSWERWGLNVSAPSQTDAAGNGWVFSAWSDGGAAQHVITTPASDATYTATFVRGFAANVNFQTASASVPAGYVADTGLSFGARGNGLSYGWNQNTPDTRDRDAAASPDQRYDTLNHMQKPSNPNGVWELAVPNGRYEVHVVMGDAAHFDSVFRLNAEGVPILNATPTSASRWKEATATVNVSDGRLSLSNGAGAQNNKLCFVDVVAR